MSRVATLISYALGVAVGQGGWHACPVEGRGSPCVSRPDASCMSAEQAIAIATTDARRLGIDVTEYEPPRTHYGCDGAGCTWSVGYSARSLAIGDHFGIAIDDADCTSTLHPGL